MEGERLSLFYLERIMSCLPKRLEPAVREPCLPQAVEGELSDSDSSCRSLCSCRAQVVELWLRGSGTGWCSFCPGLRKSFRHSRGLWHSLLSPLSLNGTGHGSG